MSDMPTIIETNKDRDNGWGGNAWGAGVGGFIGSMFGNGGWGGWGYGGRGAGQVGADVALGNAIQNVQNAVNANGLSQLQSANGIQQGINANTVAQLQGDNATQQQICCLGGTLGEKIDRAGDQTVAAINQGVVTGLQTQMQTNDRLCAISGAVTNQGYQNQLQTKDVIAAMAGQTADLKAAIIEQGCQDRETMREIAAQAVRDKLAEANAKIANLETRQALTDSNQNQTLYMMAQIQNLFQQYKTTTAAAGA